MKSSTNSALLLPTFIEKNKLSGLIMKLGSMLVLGIFLSAIFPHTTSAQVSSWQQGASMVSWESESFSGDGFRQSLQDLRDTGASHVIFVIPYYQSSTSSDDISRGWNTPSDDVLISAIDYAHSLGLEVVLKPHLDVYTGEWRAEINAADRDRWFDNYGNMLRHYALIAEERDVSGMTIGTELIRMATYTSNADNTRRWKELISSMRDIYSGFLTYSANWGTGSFADEKSYIGFWNDLDYIGISAYYSFSEGSSVEELRSTWDQWRRSDIEPLYDQYGKPILFTEIGYRSVEGAHNEPWYFCYCGNFDEGEQARLYEALFSYWDDYSYMRGVHLWHWEPSPNAGGSGNVDYTPQNKQAEEVIRRWFAGGGDDGGDDDNEGAHFEDTAQAIGSIDQSSANVEFSLRNSGGSVANIILDLELYDGSNKIDQVFFEGETLGSGEEKKYQADFSPGKNGEFVAKLGVFSSGWQRVIYWNDDVMRFSVGSDPGNDDPPSTGEINIWWPTDGSQVSGIQPFKAQLIGWDVSDYVMYWQVGDGQLNLMYNTYEDYPHKEVAVDLSGWRWEPSGLYPISFVATDADDAVISKNSATIRVSH